MFKNVLNTIKKHSVAVKLYCVAFTLIFTLTVVFGFVANVIPEGEKIQIVRNSLTVTGVAHGAACRALRRADGRRHEDRHKRLDRK